MRDPFSGKYGSELQQLRFLVVDDSAHMRRLVRTMLFSFGCREIYEAEDGVRGLELFVNHLPEIVITDLVMPPYDGLTLTRMIRQPGTNANPEVPIIMLTCHAEKSCVLAARDAGVTEFLAKPISAKDLHLRILHIVNNQCSLLGRKNHLDHDRKRRHQTNNHKQQTPEAAGTEPQTTVYLISDSNETDGMPQRA